MKISVTHRITQRYECSHANQKKSELIATSWYKSPRASISKLIAKSITIDSIAEESAFSKNSALPNTDRSKFNKTLCGILDEYEAVLHCSNMTHIYKKLHLKRLRSPQNHDPPGSETSKKPISEPSSCNTINSPPQAGTQSSRLPATSSIALWRTGSLPTRLSPYE
jgi:hypothetical protein